MDFWQFLGQYWWIAFPLMGVAGGASRAWRVAARDRHERRLETMRARAELRAAKRGIVLEPVRRDTMPDASAPASVAASAPATEAPDDTLARTIAAHDAVTRRWLEKRVALQLPASVRPPERAAD
ncbi:hypothetical protein [uncultured Microbacterium sp.]|uniref:hypothetical protein n=1 Tax=uncultured Microbacterium sp. TaxID=191216 RepID=UPI0025CB8CF1|nr:hypothetical protein [uncultured Microbacterium sp.]